jgi:transposase-like protein
MTEKGNLKMIRKIRRYTQEFKDEAVKLALDTSSVAQAAKDLGLPLSTLHSWINQSKLLVLDPHAKDSDSQPKINMSQLLEKNRELQKRVNRLEQEKSILKKAAMYFAKEVG